MQTSESIKEITAALLTVQKELTKVKKKGNNPHFKSSYAQLNDVLDAIKEPLNNNGIIFIQTPSNSDKGCSVTTRLIHSSGEWIQDTATCPLAKQDPQGYGSAVTYLRRYSLVSIVGLEQVDDDGNDGSGLGDDKKDDTQEFNSPAVKVRLINELMKSNHMGPEDFYKITGERSLKDIAIDDAKLDAALNKLRVVTTLGAKTV